MIVATVNKILIILIGVRFIYPKSSCNIGQPGVKLREIYQNAFSFRSVRPGSNITDILYGKIFVFCKFVSVKKPCARSSVG